MSKRLSATEINAITDYVTDVLYNEKIEEIKSKHNTITKDEFRKLEEKVEKFDEKIRALYKEFEDKNLVGKVYDLQKLNLNRVRATIYRTHLCYSGVDMPDRTRIRDKVHSRVVITNLASEIDVNKLIEELRAII